MTFQAEPGWSPMFHNLGSMRQRSPGEKTPSADSLWLCGSRLRHVGRETCPLIQHRVSSAKGYKPECLKTCRWKKVVKICNNNLDCFHSMSLHYINFTVLQKHGIKVFFCDGPRPKETQSVASNSSPQTTEGLAIIALISLMLKHKGIASPQRASTLLPKGKVIVELSDILICPSFQLPLCVVLCSGRLLNRVRLLQASCKSRGPNRTASIPTHDVEPYD